MHRLTDQLFELWDLMIFVSCLKANNVKGKSLQGCEAKQKMLEETHISLKKLRRTRDYGNIHILSLLPHSPSRTTVDSIYTACTVAGLGRLHCYLIACHMKKLCLLSLWINWRSILPRKSWACICACTWVYVCEARQISLNVCKEKGALKDAAALMSSFTLACTGKKAYTHTHTYACGIIWHTFKLLCVYHDRLPPGTSGCSLKKWVDPCWKTSLSFNSFLYPISIMWNWFLLSALDQK